MITVGPTIRQRFLGANGPPSLGAEVLAHGFRAGPVASAVRAAAATEPTVAFGPFRLLPTRLLLLEGDRPVRLGSRALEILIALVERPGELIGKNELMARVWPSTFVEEGNLKVQVAGLRRALGDSRGSNRYLATVPGRGYCFVAPVSRTDELGPLAPPAPVEARQLPASITPMIDRADSVGALTAQLSHQRFITIVGPGGIGKTTVALAVARSLIDSYDHGACFIDLATVVDPRPVPGAFAATLGLTIGAKNPILGLSAALADKRMLLVLDNCEHVIEAAAALAIEVLNRAPGVQILATSREPLRAKGERVHRLPALESPPALVRLTAADALGFPAVQLFVERAAATSSAFTFGDENAPLVANICRRLDGIPLAIELAAARVDAFGVHGLAVHLRDPLQLLTRGRRTAPPRHQTMRAMLDWSHELLSEPERSVLRRVAIFAGGFTLEAASAIAAGAEIAGGDVVDHVANLVGKSLIAADIAGSKPCYGLLGTTRAYALEKLLASGELEAVRRRHAEFARGPARRAEAAWATRSTAERLAACGRRIVDGGATQDWARSPTDPRRSALPATPLPAAFHL